MVSKIKSGMEHSLEELKNDTKGSYYYKNNIDNCRSYGLGKPWDFFQFNVSEAVAVGGEEMSILEGKLYKKTFFHEYF